jgi:NAD(P)-dependent dehydrogenase (short-subunit alcohol dehydrogenase family)
VRALALELAGKNIRVNAVSPSNIKTPLYESGAEDVNTEESLKRLMENQPLGLGTPEQVALPVCFLLSDAASFITGVDLPVDGGYLAH